MLLNCCGYWDCGLGVGNLLWVNGIWYVKYLFVVVVILKINSNRNVLKFFDRFM